MGLVPVERRNRHHHAVPPADKVSVLIEYRLDLPYSHAIGNVLFVRENEERHARQML